MAKLSRLQIALKRGDEKLYPATENPGVIEPEIRPPSELLCPVCGGMGYIKAEGLPVGHKWFGQFIKCTHPDCKAQEYNRKLRQASLEEAYSSSDAGEDYKRYTFGSWLDLPLIKQRGKEFPLYAAKRLANNPFEVFTFADVLNDVGVDYQVIAPNEESENPDDWYERVMIGEGKDAVLLQNTVGNWLVFESSYGMGKTGMAMAALNAADARGYYTRFVHLPTYMDAWHKTYSIREDERLDAQAQLMDPLKKADLLLVDEVNVADDGKGSASPDKTRIFMNHIIQPRWLAGEQKPTIFTTNKPAADFGRHWGERIASRVWEKAHWFKFGGVALRHQNRPIGG